MPAATPADIPADLLESLDDLARAAVLDADAHAAAGAILDVVDAMPPFSSSVKDRSRWLGVARSRVAASDDVSEEIDVRLLAAIAQTAFAAHETVPALTASEQALAAASDIGAHRLELLVIIRRMPHLAQVSPTEATADMRRLRGLVQAVGPGGLKPTERAELQLAQVTWLAGRGRWDDVRRALAAVGRIELGDDERITFIAYASQCAVAQMAIRNQQRLQAVQSIVEAARLAAELEAFGELANLQVVLAAYAVRAGDFNAAMDHASSALTAASSAQVGRGQPDPWLGVPFDIAGEAECAAIIRVLAEAAVHALGAGDRVGFLLTASALVAFYLLDDRAPEALDALHEAIEAAEQGEDTRGVKMLHDVSEGLLRHMGMLQ